MLSCQFNRQQVSVINCRKTSTVLMAHLLRSFAFGGAKKKPLALWIYGRISVFYFHSIKPVRIEFRNVTICFFFRQSKMDLMEKKHYTMYQSVYRFVEFLIWKVGFHRWLFFLLEFTHMQTLSWHIYSKLQNPENKVISIEHLDGGKIATKYTQQNIQRGS